MKRISSFIFAVLLMLVLCLNAFAIGENTGTFCIEFNENSEFITFSPASRSNCVITIPLVGMSSIIEFDEQYDLSSVTYITSDPNVVVAYDRRILAVGIGTATVTINCGNLSQVINVSVEDKLSQSEILQMESSTNSNSRSNTTQRQNMAQKAIDMVYYRWTPEYNLTGWRGNYTFYADTSYTGLPYSQTVYQCDDDEFEVALSYDDFYSSYTYLSKTMPKYGNDCSAFVAICWGLPYDGGNRYTTYTFMNNYSELTNGYEDLLKGDAVVMSDHIMLVTQNHEIPPSGSGYTESYVVTYEQTPPSAILSFWTYDQLESLGYEAISYFS